MDKLDSIDSEIIKLLQRDGRLPQAEIADIVGLKVSSVHERIKKLEKRGAIKKYVAIADPETLGKPLLAFIRISTQAANSDQYDTSRRNVITLCETEPDILECHHVAGEDCYILKVRAADPKGLEKILGRILQGSFASRSVTNLVFSTFKESTEINPHD